MPQKIPQHITYVFAFFVLQKIKQLIFKLKLLRQHLIGNLRNQIKRFIINHKNVVLRQNKKKIGLP